jgi:aminopeptidase N
MPPPPLHTSSQDFVFSDVPEEPLPSLLRGFSAPVKLVQPLTDAQLAFLAANDNDPFNRWDALQRLYQKALLEQVR